MLYDFFVAVVTLPYTLVVCAFNFAVSLAQAAVNLGLQIIGTLCALVASAVSAAETAVVNAFNAFVAWIVDFVKNVISSAFSGIGIETTGVTEQILSDVNSANSTVASGAQTSEFAGRELAQKTLDSQFVQTISMIVLLIEAISIVIAVFTAPYSFIISQVVVPLIIFAIIGAVLQLGGAVDITGFTSTPYISMNTMKSILGTGIVAGISTLLSVMLSWTSFLIKQVQVAINPIMRTGFAFALSCLGLLFSMSSFADLSKELRIEISAAATGLSTAGIILLINSPLDIVAEGLTGIANKIIIGIATFSMMLSVWNLYSRVVQYG
jgi:hypothetical protein